MQDGILNPPHWLQLILAALASLVARDGIVKVYHVWLNRKKPAAEVEVTHATAAEIHVRAGSSAGEAIMRFMDRLDAAQRTIDRLRQERDEWEIKAFDLQSELRDSRQANMQLVTQSKLDNHQIRKQMAFIEAKDLKDEYVALDRPKA